MFQMCIRDSFQARRFDRDLALVVIHGDDHVEFAVEGSAEDRVGGQGAGYVEALRLGCGHGRGDVFRVFGTGGVGV